MFTIAGGILLAILILSVFANPGKALRAVFMLVLAVFGMLALVQFGDQYQAMKDAGQLPSQHTTR